MKVDINNPAVVVILSIPVIGSLLDCLLKEQLEKERQSGNSQFTKSLPSCSHDNNNRVLVLCINATKEDVLQSLGMNRRVMANSCEELYRATKYLWMGTETDFSETPLKS